ncbi:DUF676-domain-containing protein [Pseudovirgaria hyperparasitica]|uniref:DUF676-domain-containing protein n=1 Tax=Pseudovirgaria hyperparasitica TaxID=470096 RepID=A0A6A6WHG8_9PEZI|nr:DUF676-domain-containing protein [Pseudovirgaria hyperparasitica]KAF2761436.1 DUF676-domain-containing protein [Pseudovirgaria hyperparasitica]
MLLPPRTYLLAQTADEGSRRTVPFLVYGSTLQEEERALRKARDMLLVHQTGSVKVGEVIRYTITYTPSADRILPIPPHLHVKVKNTSAIPLRAAYLHGPYTIHASAYPSTYNPNQKVENPKRDGIPAFEPNVKAGGSWNARLTIPEDIRDVEGGALKTDKHGEAKKMTWIVEVSSQVMFSKTASVNFEVLVSRDERSLEIGFASVTGGGGKPQSGQLHDHQQGKHKGQGSQGMSQKGVYSKAIELVVDDTQSLWNKPALPTWDDEKNEEQHEQETSERKERAQRRVHLVVVTHGLHSNLGADMLYLKESIDATVKNARVAARERRKAGAVPKRKSSAASAEKEPGPKSEEEAGPSIAPLSGGQEDLDNTANQDDEDDDEEVIVRGFSGNAVRTEKGIQYLGKRLAKHVLSMTYPDQPFMPIKRTLADKMSETFSPSSKPPSGEGPEVHPHSSIHHPDVKKKKRAYRFAHISFIGHSLGGLTQMYAIAYIQKHSPKFFEIIEPVNFIALASPFLGLSNENPVYVKFALDFGLVGKTGQDLGLTWTAPTIAKNGWTSIVSGFGNNDQKEKRGPDPGAKPVLRILPTGPAHHVLRLFRNRTVYSNVVNDGIVPLRTSCLLFLDWRGIGRVDKARRENGLIGTVAEWGFAQLSGQNTSPNPSKPSLELPPPQNPKISSRTQSPSGASGDGSDTAVPLPGEDTTNLDDTMQTKQTTGDAEPASSQFIKKDHEHEMKPRRRESRPKQESLILSGANTLSRFLSFLQPSGAHTAKDSKMFKRSQTIKMAQPDSSAEQSSDEAPASEQPLSQDSSPEETSPKKKPKRPKASRGDSMLNNPEERGAPPKTTIFESAGDLINPPIPPTSWLIDPSTRSRTIFHDRVYHPEDIPPPPPKSKSGRTFGSVDSASSSKTEDSGAEDSGGMRVEEKIARAYHKDLSWRKVLVRLEPDAHNNIVVRRMFANAYGWPVIKHLCDTHFGDTYSAKTRDEDEAAVDRAPRMSKGVGPSGEEVDGQQQVESPDRDPSDMREEADELKPLREFEKTDDPVARQRLKRQNTDLWDDSYFEDSGDDDSDTETDDRNPIARYFNPSQSSKKRVPGNSGSPTSDQVGTSPGEIAKFLTASPAMEGHRGLSPTQAAQKSSVGLETASPVSPTYSADAPGAITGQQSDTLKASSPRDADSLQSMLPGEPLVQSPPHETEEERPKTGGSTSSVGLGKSIEEQLHSPALSTHRRSSSGVGEQVTRLSMEGKK